MYTVFSTPFSNVKLMQRHEMFVYMCMRLISPYYFLMLKVLSQACLLDVDQMHTSVGDDMLKCNVYNSIQCSL